MNQFQVLSHPDLYALYQVIFGGVLCALCVAWLLLGVFRFLASVLQTLIKPWRQGAAREDVLQLCDEVERVLEDTPREYLPEHGKRLAEYRQKVLDHIPLEMR